MSVRTSICSAVLALTLSAPMANAADAQSNIPASVAADLLYQLEMLQQEVSQLRGQVERQSYELDKMKSLQKDRYIDLDKRVSEAMTQARKAATQVPTTPQTTAVETTGTSSESSVASAPVKLTPASDAAKAAYESAYQLIKSKDFEKARTAFRTFVEQYPNNTLTGNGHYWLGELALVLGNQGEALVQFKTVTDEFSGHSKVPDATYKLGIVNDQMGNQALARDYFNRTVQNFADSNAAKLATNYLNNMQ